MYGYLWEPGEVYLEIECSAFKRKPLSLIFGIWINKFKIS